MASPVLRAETRGAVRLLTLDRPPVNALNGELVEALGRAVDEAAGDAAVQVVVVYGGRRAFSAGADLRELGALGSTAEQVAWIARGAAMCDRLAALGKPTIAAIEGHCLGGGLELAMACGMRVAAATARLGQPEVKLGIVPGFGGTQRLPGLVPPGVALEMLLTGEAVDAERARELGLVNRVVTSGAALDAALELAAALAGGSASAMAAILRAARGEVAEIAAVEESLASPDAREGIAAFLEKRAARFEGAL